MTQATIPPDPTGGRETVLYTTPEKRIGNTLWRLQVYEKWDLKDWRKFEYGLCRYTRYQFKSTHSTDGLWHKATEHPKYDFNDGTYAGLPKGLRKLYFEHEQEIQAALKPEIVFELVEGEGAPQYTFDVKPDQQYSLF